MSAILYSFIRIKPGHRCLVSKLPREVFSTYLRQYSNTQKSSPFGLLFDIDGVLVRGKNVLPSVPECFKRLVDSNGNFRIPTVIVTNAGNALRSAKAEQLTQWLGVKIHEEQVIMAHSPLRMFTQFHNKKILISGQGPIREIAENLGFTNVTTIDEIRKSFPALDAVDLKRRLSAPLTIDKSFEHIEAIVLFGEPVRWETTLQLIMDLLVCNGHPSERPTKNYYPHIPILACNMDLQWMAEAWLPRFGHGAFLLCLENLYKKITGNDLIYSALVGKPSEITYYHAHHKLLDHSKKINKDIPIKRLYGIGDNIYTDIYGANLYNQFLERSTKGFPPCTNHRNFEHLLDENSRNFHIGTESCYSILVQTGVFIEDNNNKLLDHPPRDFLPMNPDDCLPNYTVKDVSEAIDLIFRKERFI